MSELEWVKYSDSLDVFEVRNYLFERKLIDDEIIYEIWKNSDELIFRLSDYNDFMDMAEAIIELRVS